MEFMQITQKQKELLCDFLEIDKKNLTCYFCNFILNIKDKICIMPPIEEGEISTILCNNIMCLSEYFNVIEKEVKPK